MEYGRPAVHTRNVIGWLVVIGVLLAIAWAAWWAIQNIAKQHVTLQLNGVTLQAELAQTESELRRGLSGRSNLPDERALLLVFAEDGPWEIWMKDMRFAIDIIWLDQHKKVVHIERNIQPDSEPHRSYRPPQLARYVLEVRAGVAERIQVTVGQQAKFELEGGV